MATPHDKWVQLAKRLVIGLSAKPGVHIVDKQMTADLLAQGLAAAERSGEIQRITERK